MSDSNTIQRVQPGSHVAIKLLARTGESEHMEFDLVPDKQADYQAGFLGLSTPLAKAILGEKVGVTVPYFTEELMGIEILAVQASKRKPDEKAADRRDVSLQRAKDQIEFTSAVLFAASVDTKWGSYDADGLDYENWKTKGLENSAAKKGKKTKKA
jgi:hypothetical protein